MATSVVEIWNRALARTGNARRVANEAEQSAEAKLLRTQYPITRDRLLEGYDWAFARRYGSLSLINDETELQDGWAFAYEWPVDALAFRGLLTPGAATNGDENDPPYEVCLRATGTDRKIMAMLEDVTGVWTECVTDVHRFPPTFEHALSLALQAEIAIAIAKDPKQVQMALSLFSQAESYAQVSTANQGRSRFEGAAHRAPSIRARA